MWLYAARPVLRAAMVLTMPLAHALHARPGVLWPCVRVSLRRPPALMSVSSRTGAPNEEVQSFPAVQPPHGYEDFPPVSVPAKPVAPAWLAVETASRDDVRVLQERQLGHSVTNCAAVGKVRCKHGHPQAFMWDPMLPRVTYIRGRKPSKHFDTGLFRLSCPYLVKALDEWEAEGAVEQLNNEVRHDLTLQVAAGTADASAPEATLSGNGLAKGSVLGVGGALPRTAALGSLPLASRLREAALEAQRAEGRIPDVVTTTMLEDAHRGHAAARRLVVGDRISAWKARGGLVAPGSPPLDDLLATGISGQSLHKIDVKCLHAQLADYLCRDRHNEIGARIVRVLEHRGVQVEGCDACANQCSLATPIEEASENGWWYTPSKNKWKLRKKLENRRRRLPRMGRNAASAGL